MNISKSMVCRFGITAVVTAAIIALLWYAITVLPSKIPAALLGVSPLDIALAVLATGAFAFFAFIILIMWGESQVTSFAMGLVGVLGFSLGFFEPDRSWQHELVMMLSLVIIIEIVALTAHEYIAKKVCKRILGGNHD